MNLQGKKILFLGDSITEAVNIEKPYWKVLGEKTGAVCVGYGIGGTRIARQYAPSELPVMDRHFVTRVDSMAPDADAIVVFGGVNDFGHGDAPIGSMTDRTADTFYGALHELYTALINRYPAAQLVVMTPLHCINEAATGLNGWGKVRRDLVLKDYVEIIKEVAAFYSIPVLDAFAVSGIQPNIPVNREMFTLDGLHPNAAGHARLADKLIGFFKTL